MQVSLWTFLMRSATRASAQASSAVSVRRRRSSLARRCCGAPRRPSATDYVRACAAPRRAPGATLAAVRIWKPPSSSLLPRPPRHARLRRGRGLVDLVLRAWRPRATSNNRRRIRITRTPSEAIGSIAVHGTPARRTPSGNMPPAGSCGRPPRAPTNVATIDRAPTRSPRSTFDSRVSTWPLRKFAVARPTPAAASWRRRSAAERSSRGTNRCASAAWSSPVASVGKGVRYSGVPHSDLRARSSRSPRRVEAPRRDALRKAALRRARMVALGPRVCARSVGSRPRVVARARAPRDHVRRPPPVLWGSKRRGQLMHLRAGGSTACWWWRRRTRDAGADARCSVYDGAHRCTGDGGGGGSGRRTGSTGAPSRGGERRGDEGGEEEVPQATRIVRARTAGG